MSGVTLKRLTSFEFAVGVGYLPVHINPELVCFVMPRRRFDSTADRHTLDGTLVHFSEQGGVLAVKEDLGYVVAALQSGRGGVCKECFEILDEAWASLCVDCTRNHKA